MVRPTRHAPRSRLDPDRLPRRGPPSPRGPLPRGLTDPSPPPHAPRPSPTTGWGEATTIGNTLVQARALGSVTGSLESMRSLVATVLPPRRFNPRDR
ncbi:hypothetical protein ELQ90_02160 [Labedella phragmitis]|uniref:Uncharacterized protein n=1 Tax=Labedella phragmitis TaxID=2498849 RepID=A0A444PY03_9MICO|nr:hypothetical protein ELQ90_02160 [Labedella phragmitis]